MPTYQWIMDQLIPALSRTLLHSIWIGLAAALFAGIVMMATKRSTASTRYNWLLLVYGLVILCTVLAFLYELKDKDTISVSTNGPAGITEGVFTILVDQPGLVEHDNYFSIMLAFLDKNAQWIILAWFIVVLYRILKMGMGLKHISHIRNKQVSPAPAEWTNWVNDQARKMFIDRHVAILQSGLLKVPIAIGYLKPMILVPVGLLTNLNPGQVESILLHELAHIRRKDYLVNLLQTFVESILFFNPAILWISSLIRQERENCCDDIVIAQTNNQGDYLEALIGFQTNNLLKTYAMTLGTRKPSLLQRVKRMLTRENSVLTIKEISSLVLGIVISAFCLMAFQEKEQPTAPEAQAINEPKQVDISARVLSKETDLHIHQSPLPASVPNKDTVPSKNKETNQDKRSIQQQDKPRFKQIITNMADDGTNSVQQIQATSHDGTIYKIRKVENEITSFTINGKEIAKEEYAKNYNEVIAAINLQKEKRNKEAIKAQQKRQQEIKARQNKIASKQARLHSEKQKRLDTLNRLKAERHQKASQKLQNKQSKLFRQNSNSNSNISSIIRDLSSANMIQNETQVSFYLDNSQFIVNGKVQPAAVFESFRSKYLKSPEDRYKYSRTGNSTTTEVYIK